MGGLSGESWTIDGAAPDDVARVDALLANGRHTHVPIRDNAFLVDIPRAQLPARLVAYDAAGRVISVSPPWRDFGAGAAPARARATTLLRVSGPDRATAELLVGPSTTGGECMYVRHFVDRRHTGVMVGCSGRSW